MKRIFLALWPDTATRKHIQRITAGLHFSPRQRVNVKNLHVTLVFIGGVKDELLPEIMESMRPIKVKPFILRFDQLTCWRRPQVLCLTCSQPDAAVLRLAADLSAPLADLQIELDARPYCPHVTLVRHVTTKPEVAFEPLLWHAEEFVLVESTGTRRAGLVYQPLHTWRFQDYPSQKSW